MYFACSGRSQDHKPEFLLLKTLHILISDSLVNFEQQKCLFCLVESVRGVDTPILYLYFIQAILGSHHPKWHLGSSVLYQYMTFWKSH
jgi:hypothetical protein